MLKNIQILDCTLRDGGYVNKWNFGRKNITAILKHLDKSDIDYIECGFVTQKPADKNQSLYNSIEEINEYLPKNADRAKTVAMIKFGSFPIENIPVQTDNLLSTIRLIFKKSQKTDALNYCKQLKEKGYKIFVNPTFIDQYGEDEFVQLITQVNTIGPYGFSIVDSMGVLRENQLLEYLHIIDGHLDKNTSLCFHSHNNLQLSFSNAQAILREDLNRNLIIDSSVSGMGRGAGNLPTELLIPYLNCNYEKKYKLASILKIIDEHIAKIFVQKPWGCSIPFYLAATNSCHPDYATYLIGKKVVSAQDVSRILKNIPKEKRAIFDKNLIENLYLNNQNYTCK